MARGEGEADTHRFKGRVDEMRKVREEEARKQRPEQGRGEKLAEEIQGRVHGGRD